MRGPDRSSDPASNKCLVGEILCVTDTLQWPAGSSARSAREPTAGIAQLQLFAVCSQLLFEPVCPLR